VRDDLVGQQQLFQKSPEMSILCDSRWEILTLLHPNGNLRYNNIFWPKRCVRDSSAQRNRPKMDSFHRNETIYAKHVHFRGFQAFNMAQFELCPYIRLFGNPIFSRKGFLEVDEILRYKSNMYGNVGGKYCFLNIWWDLEAVFQLEISL